jgi:hypothetical protein
LQRFSELCRGRSSSPEDFRSDLPPASHPAPKVVLEQRRGDVVFQSMHRRTLDGQRITYTNEGGAHLIALVRVASVF